MQKPLVSILMPVYNSVERSLGGDWLVKSLDSLLRQTYENFELIILDNQSTDSTASFCQGYAKKDARIRYILDTQNRFPEGAINRLAEFMQGKYCMVANDDDLWHPDYINKLVAFLDNHQDIDMVYSGGNLLDIHGNHASKLVSSSEDVYRSSASAISSYCVYIFKRNVVPLIFGVFRADAYRKLLPFENFDDLKANVDNLFLAKFFLTGGKCEYLNEELFFYRKKSRRLGPRKIPGMPGLDRPILIWWYYVRHQFYFYKKLISLISGLNLSREKYSYLKNITFQSFLKFSLNLIGWIKYNYAAGTKDERICEDLFRLVNKNSLFWFFKDEKIGFFNDDADDNTRFNPEVLAGLLEASCSRLDAYLGLIDHFTGLNREDAGSGIVLELKELLNKEKSKFVKERSLNAANLGQRPQIFSIPDVAQQENIIARNNPLISVISCSKNLGRFLEETILTINKQSFRDFEHIVVDAKSNDGSPEILSRFPQIKLINEEDSGYLEGFWKGMRMAKGKYILQCCVSDGYLDPDWFKRCVEILEAHPEISLVWGFSQYLTENSVLGDISYAEFYHRLPAQKEEWLLYWLCTGFHLPEVNFCVRKNVFEECCVVFNQAARYLEPSLEFSYNFNAKGYLPYHIPVVANFGRTHKDQLFQRERQSGLGRTKRRNYTQKVRLYKLQVLLGLKGHSFQDGEGNILPIELKLGQIRDYYFKFQTLRFKKWLRRRLPYVLYAQLRKFIRG
jgi:glycosyltransferase involved in cell wall biosynthesis